MVYVVGNEEKMSKVYVSKRSAFGILIITVLFLVVIGYVLFNAYTASRLVNPQERLQPIGKILNSTSEKIQQIAGVKTADKSKNVLTIIFFYDGYVSQKEAQVDAEIMQKALELVEPFKSLKDHLEYKVFTTDTRQCKVDSDSNYLVCDKELIDSFRKLGTDRFKVVLMSQENFTAVSEKARGKNSWLSIPTNPPNLTAQQKKEWLGISITKLLGHSLGLSYEGVSTPSAAVTVSIPPEAIVKSLNGDPRPNCAQDLKTAQKWWGGYAKIFPNVNYFQGCGENSKYYYPEEGTLMSLAPKKETYGRVSEDYLRGVLTCFYGKGKSITFAAGKEATYSASLKNCGTFISQYPNFWNE